MKTLIVLPLCLCATVALADETVYSWVDAEGVTHYSQNPPDQTRTAVERIELNSETSLSVIGDSELRPAEQEALETILEDIDRDALQPTYPPRTRVIAGSRGGVGTTGVTVGTTDVNGNLTNDLDSDRDNDGVLDTLEDRTTGPTDIPPQISTIDAGIPPQLSTTGDERFGTPLDARTDRTVIERNDTVDNTAANTANNDTANNSDFSRLEEAPASEAGADADVDTNAAARATGGAITANESGRTGGGVPGGTGGSTGGTTGSSAGAQ